jgi:hypothetical protein
MNRSRGFMAGYIASFKGWLRTLIGLSKPASAISPEMIIPASMVKGWLSHMSEIPLPSPPATQSKAAKADGETTMNIFATILGYALALLPTIVTSIQTEVGDSQSGATKSQMATDALNAALQGAAAVIPAGTTNSVLASASGAVAGEVIDISSTLASVMNHVQTKGSVATAVALTKKTGAYQAATAAAVAAKTPAAA